MEEILMIIVMSSFVLVMMMFPFAVIWAMNTLFGLVIDYNFYSWLAVVIIGAFLHVRITRQK